MNRVVPRDELDDATLALAKEIAKNEPFVVQTTKRAVNRAWDVAGFRAAMAANTELDVMIETANLPARDEFRRITQEQGLEGRDRVAGREVPRRRGVSRWNLGPLLAPRSIAIVGASESPDSWAPEIERSLRHVGFDGRALSRSTRSTTRSGAGRAWPRSRELPRGVDLVVFVVPARVVVRMIDDCGAAGVAVRHGRVVGVRGGGRRGARAAGGAARDGAPPPPPVLGPNVEGFVNYVDRVAPYGTTPPPDPVAGSISVISQSGTVAWTMNQLASDRGAGLRIILGVGNEAVLGLGRHVRVGGRRSAHEGGLHATSRRCATWRGSAAGWTRSAPRASRSWSARPEGGARRRGDRSWRTPARWPATRRSATPGSRARRRSSWRTRSRCSRRPCCCRPCTRMRTTGVAAALQSGGACTLFAEAAGAQGLALAGVLGGDQATAAEGAAALRVAEQPAGRDRAGRRRDRHVLRRARRAGARPGGGVRGVRRVPASRWRARTRGPSPSCEARAGCGRTTGVVFASSRWVALAYGAAAQAIRAPARRLPFLQGHRAAAGAIRALVELQSAARAARCRDLPPHPNRREGAPPPARHGRVRSTRRQGARLLELYGVRRPKERIVTTAGRAAEAARDDRVPGGREGAGAGAPAQGEARRGPARPARTPPTSRWRRPRCCRRRARAGAASPRVLVQEMATGAEVLVGAVVDDAFGACITMRPGGALAEAGEATFVRGPLTPAQAPARTCESQAGAMRSGPEAATTCGPRPGPWRSIARAAHDLRGRLTSLEANPLLVRSAGAVAVDALAEARPSRVIYGLVAALGLGLADFDGAIAGRRMGSLWHGDRRPVALGDRS